MCLLIVLLKRIGSALPYRQCKKINPHAQKASSDFSALRTCIEAGKNVVDISFFPEDAFVLNELARHLGVTALVDCGVAPGKSNILLGH